MLGDAFVAVPVTLAIFLLLRREVLARNRMQAAHDAVERRLTQTLQSAREAIIGIDEDKRIFLHNPAAEQIFGYESEEVQGQPIGLLLPEASSKLPQSDLRHGGMAIERPIQAVWRRTGWRSSVPAGRGKRSCITARGLRMR